jgi:hypothetical protein
MHADSAYVIGQAHEVCQDYALAGLFPAPDVAFAIVADGCSMGKNSDVGARILALHARRRLLDDHFTDWTNPDERSRMMALASERAWTIGVCAEDGALDSTLLIAAADMHGGRKFTLFGDGILVSAYGDGRMRVHSIEFPSGYPYYLSYMNNAFRREQFQKVDKGRQIDMFYHEPWFKKPEASSRMEPTGTWHYTLDESSSKPELMLVMSDGMRAFTRSGESGIEQVPLMEALSLFMKFKSYKGRFIQRRLNRFLKDASKLGWKWHDDISIAGIYIGEQER